MNLCTHAYMRRRERLLDYWKITFLQIGSLLSKLAQLQFPFVFNSRDLMYGNYLQA